MFNHECDMELFGREHLDYIISVSLKSLRQFGAWTSANELDPQAVYSVDTLMQDAGLACEHATHLHELMRRSTLFRQHSGRYVGYSIPMRYR